MVVLVKQLWYLAFKILPGRKKIVMVESNCHNLKLLSFWIECIRNVN